jgi:hypothetical protein
MDRHNSSALSFKVTDGTRTNGSDTNPSSNTLVKAMTSHQALLADNPSSLDPVYFRHD